MKPIDKPSPRSAKIDIGGAAPSSPASGPDKTASLKEPPAPDRLVSREERRAGAEDTAAVVSAAVERADVRKGPSKLPDVVGVRLHDPGALDGPHGPPKSGTEPRTAYGYTIGSTEADTLEEVLDKNWGNNDGKLSELEAACHWAAFTLNDLFGAHVRISLNPDTPKAQLDRGSTYVTIDEPTFRHGVLDRLERAGVPMSLEAHMGLMLEIVTPAHLKKAYGRPPTKRETLSLVAKALARRHVPIADYLKVLESRGGMGGRRDRMVADRIYKDECTRIGWSPPDAP